MVKFRISMIIIIKKITSSVDYTDIFPVRKAELRQPIHSRALIVNLICKKLLSTDAVVTFM